MKHKIFIFLGAMSFMAAAGAFAAQGDYGALGAKEQSNLSLEEMLTFAIQDEYLARAEYEAIMAEYGRVRPFTNIIKAEERHIGELRDTFAALGLAAPEDDSAHRSTVPASLKTAYKTAVAAEVENIAMYQAFLGSAAAQPLPAEVRELFQRLADASGKHLQAFQNRLARAR